MAVLRSLSILTFFLSASSAMSSPATYDGNVYKVAGVGDFNTLLQIDFTKVHQLPSDLAIDTYTVGAGSSPYSRSFTTDNVVFNPGDSMSLLVPGGQTTSPIRSAEVRTSYNDILYGSVRTVAKAATAAGTCHGFFFYLNDNQETDVEILSSDPSKTHFTNQAVKAGGDSTTLEVNSPSTVTSAYHEYRIDWIKGKTMFYIDGVLKGNITENVPSSPGPWIWNNWSSGNSWSQGPPRETSDLRIRSITAYFNRTSVASKPHTSRSSQSVGTASTAAPRSSVATTAHTSSQKPTSTSTGKPSSSVSDGSYTSKAAPTSSFTYYTTHQPSSYAVLPASYSTFGKHTTAKSTPTVRPSKHSTTSKTSLRSPHTASLARKVSASVKKPSISSTKRKQPSTSSKKKNTSTTVRKASKTTLRRRTSSATTARTTSRARA